MECGAWTQQSKSSQEVNWIEPLYRLDLLSNFVSPSIYCTSKLARRLVFVSAIELVNNNNNRKKQNNPSKRGSQPGSSFVRVSVQVHPRGRRHYGEWGRNDLNAPREAPRSPAHRPRGSAQRRRWPGADTRRLPLEAPPRLGLVCGAVFFFSSSFKNKRSLFKEFRRGRFRPKIFLDVEFWLPYRKKNT